MGIVFQSSPWTYDTSEETSGSIVVATAGSGTLYFLNSDTGETMQVPYNYAGLGGSKGLVANWAVSTVDNTSVGTSVQVPPWGSFDASLFPCQGGLISVGGGVGLNTFGGSSGGCACI
jgi:hypothetical protein